MMIRSPDDPFCLPCLAARMRFEQLLFARPLSGPDESSAGVGFRM